jgi:hypothetical protein
MAGFPAVCHLESAPSRPRQTRMVSRPHIITLLRVSALRSRLLVVDPRQVFGRNRHNLLRETTMVTFGSSPHS